MNICYRRVICRARYQRIGAAGAAMNLGTGELGVSLLEILMAMALFAIIGLGVSQSAIQSLHYQKSAEIGNLARNLAVSRAEELSGIPLYELDSSDSETETTLSVTGHTLTFNRVTTVTVNSDGSRSIDVTVGCNTAAMILPVSYSTRFAPWES